ncbi:CDP-diacylglycerol--glycerol-3-phosphate 3-phosphatidyltransferase [Motilibacter rhizosphaerae]|uniref:CDP-diacylglycerol--glycerol-3-phosphate 3-phosphatidyltransferase n=1 Tax=Motilibacter rhizosphaerae TaxID=598652 RepID=A0A4Q7NGM7_9ACTN|nr:CDP-alcohol phosphatidyltransferase family protein [Motilibacter rhizosphaerae]RZS82944.1 CDP-diacylglycerol--glycerol-3-phosphate 3-phosphatidyltransferase [Motilibacter rhizosphaerae]
MTLEEYLAAWSRLHAGIVPTGMVRGWLRVAYALARPLAVRRVPPDAVTLAGLVLGALVPVACLPGAAWPLAGAALTGLTGLVDGLDGAVAVLTGRTTRWGWLLDSVVDRVTDACFVLALAVLGAPPLLAGAALVLASLQEYARARAAAGGTELPAYPVGERATRVVVVALFAVGAAVGPGPAPAWGTAGAAALVAGGATGCAQLLLRARRELRG